MTSAKRHRVVFQRALLATFCALAACIPNAGSQAPVGQTGFCVRPAYVCTPDPGPQPVNCVAAEEGIEFAPFMIADFEEGSGQYMYSYTDATAQVISNGDNGERSITGYEPPVETASRCAADVSNHALHISGGPFLGWGGGVGISMSHLNPGLCPYGQSPPPELCPPADADGAVAVGTLDMSQWDGVAVWARRGPDSQPLLRVLVGNKYVDEDISFLEYSADKTKPRYCERVRECDCVNGRTCGYWTGSDAGAGYPPGYYCGDPATDPPPVLVSVNGLQATNRCNITQCNLPYAAYADRGPDPAFYNRPCTPYTFRTGTQESLCWDPASDPPPAESDQQCGDYWTFPLHLTTEWQLFLVPFTTMYQQGWAKRWPSFDTSSVSVVRLTWDAGWIDYWIDNLRFYRVKR